jgi:hypothetical protein
LRSSFLARRSKPETEGDFVVNESQKIAAMQFNEADSPLLSLAKSAARMTIRRHGVEAAIPQIERALGMIPPPTPKVTVAAPITIAAAPAASAATELSKRMPYQPTVIPPQVSADPRVAAIAAAAIAAFSNRGDLYPDAPDTLSSRSELWSPPRSPEQQREHQQRQLRDLAGLAVVRAAARPVPD